MGKIVLYLAMSVDGYIADEQGGVDWLGGDDSQPDAPAVIQIFIKPWMLLLWAGPPIIKSLLSFLPAAGPTRGDPAMW